MGTATCKAKAETLPHEYIASDGRGREAVLQEGIDVGSTDTNELDDGCSPLQKFINTHQTANMKGASNGLAFQSVLQEQKQFGVQFESIKLLKPQGAGDDSKKKSTIPRSKIRRPPRCSIDCSNVTQFKTTIKNFVVTEQNMGDSFGRIQISQQKFIHLQKEDPRKHYRFCESIGEGSYGSVYRVVCLKSNELRAVKIIKKETLGRGKRDEVFAELELLKKMDHPNIIKLYEVFEWDNRYQVVMEFCDGGSFIDFIKFRNEFDEGVIKVILKQLLGCLNYLHAIKIVHRDLKLQNVVFIKKLKEGYNSDQIEIKLLDFGTAYRMNKGKVKCSQLIGTVSYIPPQIIKGFFTNKCDLWSCGVIFYILLTSKSPFKCKKKEKTLEKILSHEIIFNDACWNQVSANAKELLLKLLEKDPYKRLSANEALTHSWFVSNSEKAVPKSSGFLNELSNYYRQNNLISVLESYLVFSKVGQEERKRISALFKEVDKNMDGFIEKSELIQAFKINAPGEYDPKEVEFILNKVDKDQSGCINLNEFTSAMVDKQKLWARTALEEAFDYFDKDKTGFIQKNELASLLTGSPNSQVERVLQEVDTNNDHKISKEQFISYLLMRGCLF